MGDQVAFDLDLIPFSYRGSWLSVSRVVGLHERAEQVHLVSHQTGMHAVIALEPVVDGESVAGLPRAYPSHLRWEAAGGFIELTFADTETIRVRGRGLALRLTDAAARLTSFTGNYLYTSPVDGSTVLTSYETGRRYSIRAHQGEMTVEGAERLGEGRRDVTVGADGAEWDLLIRESTSIGGPDPDTRAFGDVVAARASEFSAFADGIAPFRQSDPAATLAAYVLWSATVGAAGFVTREAVLMSKHWMDKVWSWDHCFNALALAASHPELALDQFLLVFDHQSERGALPDSITHSEVLYNFVKPPIHGWAFAELRRRLGMPVPVEVLRSVYDGLAAWSRFWLDDRRAPSSTLPFYEHGNDSGWDNSTVFDRDRVVESPDLAAFLMLQLEVVADLAHEVGEDPGPWRDAARSLEVAVGEHLWDGERMFARSVVGHRAAASTSLLTALPLLAGDRLPARAAPKLVQKVRDHLTPYGLATELVDSRCYEPDGYWRGPIWAPSTYIVRSGLTAVGADDLADEVGERFLRLCRASGFAENFDALSGHGLRDRAYTWTAAVYLLIAGEAAGRA